MDRLQDHERALAWHATWDPSFAGLAIVNPDFTFKSVNNQFCEILGATPGELIDQKFTDITPQPIKELDIINARLVMSQTIPSYLLPKTFEMKDGRKVEVIFLVVGVFDREQNFLFFVSRILKDHHKPQNLTSQFSSQKSVTFISTIRENWHIVLAVLSAMAMVFSFIIEKLHLLKEVK